MQATLKELAKQQQQSEIQVFQNEQPISDTEEEDDGQPRSKRPRKHRFKTFAQRVAEVDVTVYRSLAPKRAEPLPGSNSFFQEKLSSWKELNAAADWLEAASALQPLCQTLPQLLHHQTEILEILLSKLTMVSALSLEPILDLLGVLARDLQTDFLPHIPILLAALSDLVDEGLSREPELLEHLFACLSSVCKYLVKPLSSNLLPTLACTQRLRHHKADHVRLLTGKSLGYLFRQAKEGGLRSGLQALLEEAVNDPQPHIVQSAGIVIAESVMGVGNGLHSRASTVLQLVFRTADVLSIWKESDEEGSKSAKTKTKKNTAVEVPFLAQHDEEVIKARIAAVASECLEHLLQHITRETAGPLWTLLQNEATSSLDTSLTTTSSKLSSSNKDDKDRYMPLHDAARAIALLSQAVEHHRGARCDDYTALFKLAARLASSEVLDISSAAAAAAAAAVAAAANNENEATESIHNDANASMEPDEAFFKLQLSSQTLRLMQALVYAHCKVVGASEGPVAIARAAPSWFGIFTKCRMSDLLKFIRALITFPAVPDVARPFGSQILAAVGKQLLILTNSDDGDPHHYHQQEEEEGYEDLCWPLLADCCSALSSSSILSSSSLLLTAKSIGPRLSDLVARTAQGHTLSSSSAVETTASAKKKKKKGGKDQVQAALSKQKQETIGGPSSSSFTSRDVAVCWAALQCLPYSGKSADETLACCDTLAQHTTAALSTLRSSISTDKQQNDDTSRQLEVSHHQVFMLHCSAQCILSQLCQSRPDASEKLAALLPGALQLLEQYPSHYHAVHAASVILEAANAAGVQLESETTLKMLLPLLESNLSGPSAALRRVTLQVLCSFPMPLFLPPSGLDEAAAKQAAQTQQPCDALLQLLKIESSTLGGEGSRTAVVTLGRMKNFLEYHRLPEYFVGPVVHELLGVLHIRFAALWPPAHEALATAFDQYPSLTWPLLYSKLSQAQSDFLAGDCEARARENPLDRDTVPASLLERFEKEVNVGEESETQDSTDAAARLTHLLRALGCAGNNGVESKSKDWVHLFLEYSHSKDKDNAHEAEAEDEDEPTNINTTSSSIPAKAWRLGLKEWLSVLAGLKGVRGICKAEDIKQAVAVHVMDVEPTIQQAALKTLRAFKLQWLIPYLERLMRLADNKTLRAELAAFPLAKKATSVRDTDDVTSIQSEHRAPLVPLLVRLLFPKMRKRSGRLGGKGAPGSARAAILNFLAGAEPAELFSLLQLFLEPLAVAFVQPKSAITRPGVKDISTTSSKSIRELPQGLLYDAPWWALSLGTCSGSFWLQAIDADTLNAQPLRRRIGYLNTLEDLLKHLGHRLEPYLPELLALTLCLLEGGVAALDTHNINNAAAPLPAGEDAKEIRTRSLRILASVLERFPDVVDYNFLWERLLAVVQPLLERLPVEAAADRAPPVVELASALASSEHLATVFADQPSVFTGSSVIETETSSVSKSVQFDIEALTQRKEGSGLLASCIAVLSAETCAEATRVAVLGVVESVLDFPEELSDRIITSHIPGLLAGLQAVIVGISKQGPSKAQGKGGSFGVKRKGGWQSSTTPRYVTANRALSILEVVGGRPAGRAVSGQLVDALLPLIQSQPGGKKRSSEEGMLTRTLVALRSLWSQPLSNEGSSSSKAHRERMIRCATALAPLAGSLNSREARTALADGLTVIATHALPELATSAALLQDLVAMSDSALDEADYDRRLSGHSKLTKEVWLELDQLSAAPLVYASLRDLRDDSDLALRHAAAQSLERFVHAAASLSLPEAVEDNGASAPSALHPVIVLERKVLYPQLKRGLGANSLSVRQEHLALLRHLALNIPGRYSDLQPLVDADEEVDFLMNVGHLQLHRRARALAKLAKQIRADRSMLSMSVLVGIILPLLQQAIAEGKGGADESGHEVKQADKDKESNVADSAIGTLAAVAGSLPWVQYQQILGQYLRLMHKHAEGPAAKPVLRAVCAILDAFHFTPIITSTAAAGGADVDVAKDLPPTEVDEEAEEDGMEADKEADDDEKKREESDEVDAVPAEDIYYLLSKRVVPELRAQMVQAQNQVRAPVALAVVRALKLLPSSIMRFELPRTLQKVANLLRARLQSVRDDARTVYVAMVKELGSDYLPFAIDVLSSALPDKGFTAHVLGYTLHAVLEGIAGIIEPGSIDDCIPLIVPIIENDMFGHVSEAKEVAAFSASYKETKRNRSEDSYRILASLVTFSETISSVLIPVRSRLGEASNPKIRKKLASLLQNASRGVLSNPTASPRDLCEFVYAVIDPGLAAEESAKERAKGAAGAAARGTGNTEDAEGTALHQHLLVEFALVTFYTALKKGVVQPRNPEMAPLLSPLLPLLIRALRSRHSPSVTSALQSLCILIQCSIPGMEEASQDAGAAVTDLLKRCPKTTHPIAQDCFKLLAGMLRQCNGYEPSKAQLRFLLGWAFNELEESAERQTAFNLLKAILARKLVLPEVYDIMNNVQELMVKSMAPQVRTLASSALLMFLLDYPLGEKRARQHVEFLLSNLAYEHDTGREAALDMLQVVLQKFPEQLVTNWAEIVFLPLVIRLVNDPSSTCRTLVATTMKTLLNKISPPKKDKAALYCKDWLLGEDSRLRRAAAQTLGILAEVEGPGFSRRVGSILPAIVNILHTRADENDVFIEAQQQQGRRDEGSRFAAVATVGEDGEPEAPSASAAGQTWRDAYFCLVLLEKILATAPETLALTASSSTNGNGTKSKNGSEVDDVNVTIQQSIWRETRRLLLHSHAWIRKASGRLLGAGLAVPTIGDMFLQQSGAGTAGALALAFFRQLDSEGSGDQALAGQAVKCMVFLTLAMYEDDEAAGKVPQLMSAAAKAAAKAVVAPDNNNGSIEGKASDSDDDDDDDAEDEAEQDGALAEYTKAEEAAMEQDRKEEQDTSTTTLRGLVRRMIGIATDRSYARSLHRGMALRFIAAVAARLGPQRVVPYLPALLQPLYRIADSGTATDPPEIKNLSDEILAHLRTLVGGDALLTAYNAAQQAVRAQRTERKRKAAVLNLVNPELAAQRKIRSAQRKAAGKRKKLEEVRRMRSAGVVVKNKKVKFEQRQR